MLKDKFFGSSRMLNLSDKICSIDSSKFAHYCVNTDQLQVFFNVQETNQKVIILITPRYEYGNFQIDKYFDQMSFLIKLGGWDSYEVDGYLITDKKDSEILIMKETSYYKEIVLNGIEFEDIYSMNESLNASLFKYYISKEDGIIALEDGSGTIWTRSK